MSKIQYCWIARGRAIAWFLCRCTPGSDRDTSPNQTTQLGADKAWPPSHESPGLRFLFPLFPDHLKTCSSCLFVTLPELFIGSVESFPNRQIVPPARQGVPPTSAATSRSME